MTTMGTVHANPRKPSLVQMIFLPKFLFLCCCFATTLILPPPSNAYIIQGFSSPDDAAKRRTSSSSASSCHHSQRQRLSLSMTSATDEALSDAYKEPTTAAATASTETRTIPPFDFDFASQSGWEEYYQQLDQNEQERDQQDVSFQNPPAVPSTATIAAPVVEWHSSVKLEDLASLTLSFLQNQNVQKKNDDDNDGDDVRSNDRNILLVGCGNSLLPDVILQKQEQQERKRTSSPSSSFSDNRQCTQLILMDTSPTCLQQVQSRLRVVQSATVTNVDTNDIIRPSVATEVKYVCGDSTRLSEYFSSSCRADSGSNTDDVVFDVIVDKGLCDALWCNEGWDGMLERLFEEVAKVLRRPTTAIVTTTTDRKETEQHGTYILVCYKLSKSHKEYLIDVGQKVGLEWEFDIPPPFSTNRVSVSIATAC